MKKLPLLALAVFAPALMLTSGCAVQVRPEPPVIVAPPIPVVVDMDYWYGDGIYYYWDADLGLYFFFDDGGIVHYCDHGWAPNPGWARHDGGWRNDGHRGGWEGGRSPIHGSPVHGGPVHGGPVHGGPVHGGPVHGGGPVRGGGGHGGRR